jgi:transcriptional regulator
MHPHGRFHLTDRAAMAEFVAREGFGILFASAPEGPRAVHVPVLLAGETLRFHVSRRNAIYDALAGGRVALFVASGPHAYLSPDDYGLEGRVPTWNYLAVELEGPVRPLGEKELVDLLDAMSALHENRLAPKVPWTRQVMAEGRFAGLLKAIAGFEMTIRDWRGTAKLDQDKPVEVRKRLADALAQRGEVAMAALILPCGNAGEGDEQVRTAPGSPQSCRGHDGLLIPQDGGGASPTHQAPPPRFTWSPSPAKAGED